MTMETKLGSQGFFGREANTFCAQKTMIADESAMRTPVRPKPVSPQRIARFLVLFWFEFPNLEQFVFLKKCSLWE